MIALPISFFVQPFVKGLSARRLQCQNSAREWLSWVAGSRVSRRHCTSRGRWGRRDDFEILLISGEN